MSNSDYYQLEPTDVLYDEVDCVFGRCKLDRGRRFGARASMTFAGVTIADETRPTLGDIGGDLWTGAWLAGTRHLTFNAADNTGIKEIRDLVDGDLRSSQRRDCDLAAKTCPEWPAASLAVATGCRHRALPYVNERRSCSGNVAMLAVSATRTGSAL